MYEIQRCALYETVVILMAPVVYGFSPWLMLYELNYTIKLFDNIIHSLKHLKHALMKEDSTIDTITALI